MRLAGPSRMDDPMFQDLPHLPRPFTRGHTNTHGGLAALDAA
jgi:hypothetical protein